MSLNLVKKKELLFDNIQNYIVKENFSIIHHGEKESFYLILNFDYVMVSCSTNSKRWLFSWIYYLKTVEVFVKRL